MSEWKEVKLGEIVDIIGGGTPKTSVKEYWNGDIPWLSVTDFNNNRRYVYETEKSITEKGLNESSTKLLKKGQLIISARGTVGALAQLARDMAFNQSCYGSHGAVFDTITRETFDFIDVILPPLPEQKAIAGILSSLDDKIELLHRQNKTLEAMAETIFRKWFEEEASEDWEIKKLKDFGKIVCGKTPPTVNKEFFNGNIPFIKIPDMHNKVFVFDTIDTLSDKGAEYQANKFIPPMSICVSCIATVGLVSMNAFKCQTNQQINSLIPQHDKYRYYLFLFLRGYRHELFALGSGGTMTLNINTTLFGEIECYAPDDYTLSRFNNIIKPIFDKIFNNCNQIRTTTKLRDTLLPKLISGEIRVKV
ncbi:MAG: restriction endonuclease subunit S [Bacillota bacterium]